MANERNNDGPDNRPREVKDNRLERSSSIPNDLPDSPEDSRKLQSEETYIDLPDVKDIPGQEFVNAPPAGVMADTTIASDDEEGRSVFEADDTRDLRRGNDADVRRDERKALEQIDYLPTPDEDNLVRAQLDNEDFDGEALNEKGFGQERSGRDLDVPGATDETRTNSVRQGDEENKLYSLGSGDNDNVVEGTP